MRYIEAKKLLRDNRTDKLEIVDFTVLGNLSFSSLHTAFSAVFHEQTVGIDVTTGNYDNAIQDSFSCKSDFVWIKLDLANIVPDLLYNHLLYSSEQLNKIGDKLLGDIKLICSNLTSSKRIYISNFNTKAFLFPTEGILRLCRYLNNQLENISDARILVFDELEILDDGLIKRKEFVRSKNLYSFEFYFKLVQFFILPDLLNLMGRGKKVLVLDCDNTLWKGIVGEDGSEGIGYSKHGNLPFYHAQSLYKYLSNKGVLLCLCSKNNEQDVIKAFMDNSDMTIKLEDVLSHRINWENKAYNIESLSKELNLGLDSFVFVDDSDFEINLIKSSLPQVNAIKFEEEDYEYVLSRIYSLFSHIKGLEDDIRKRQNYKIEKKRKTLKSKLSTIDEYIRSLGLTLMPQEMNQENLPRLEQLMLKTNQFNSSNARLSQSDLLQVNKEGFQVECFNVIDSFGDYGITAMAVYKLEESCLLISSLILSCRILGRKIENEILYYLSRKLSHNSADKIAVIYNKSLKNHQVSVVLEEIGFQLNEAKNLYEVDKKFILTTGLMDVLHDN